MMHRVRAALTAAGVVTALGVSPTYAANLPTHHQPTRPVTTATSSPAETAPTPFPGVRTAGKNVTLEVAPGSPSTVTPSSGIAVTVTVRNHSQSDLTDAVLKLDVGQPSLDSRSSQATWVNGSGGMANASTGTKDVPRVAPGESAKVRVTIPSSELSMGFTAATLPLRISLDRSGLTWASWRSTVPWLADASGTNAMSASMVVPLTLPADPKLLTATGAERVEAWRKAIGPGSRIDKLLSSSTDAPVTWMIDPAVLDPATAQDSTLPDPDAVSSSDDNGDGAANNQSDEQAATNSTDAPTPTSGSGDTSTSQPAQSSSSSSASSAAEQTNTDTVEQYAARLRAKLQQRPSSQQVWFTPYGDPDLSALTKNQRPASAQSALEQTLARKLPDELSRISKTTVLAPVKPLSRTSTQRLRQAWKKSHGDEPIIVTPNATVDGSTSGSITTVARRSVDGASFWGYDAGLSSILDASGHSDASAAASLRGQTMAIYQERPSTKRSVMLMASRDVSPSRVAAVGDAMTSSPWLSPSLPQRSDLAKATPDVRLQEGEFESPDVFPRAGASAMNETDIQAVSQSLASLGQISKTVTNGGNIVPTWSENLTQLLSTRWRNHAKTNDELVRTTKQNITTIPTLVNVVPSQINFFTDSGKIAVTVKNELARGVHDVNLKLTPRAYILHFRSQPEPFSIPAQSQAGVRVETVAQSPGTVSVTTSLTGADGLNLGSITSSDPAIKINARPTSSWIFWALGIVALAIFCYGLLRNRQRGTRRRDELAREVKL